MNRNTKMAILIATTLTIGCGSQEIAEIPTEPIVLVDSKTMEAHSTLPPDSYPALNPKTNNRTLMPAMYCQRCEKWYPVPLPDQINRQPNATLCPKSHGPMTIDGPPHLNNPIDK